MYDPIGMIPLPMAPKRQGVILRPEPWMLSESERTLGRDFRIDLALRQIGETREFFRPLKDLPLLPMVCWSRDLNCHTVVFTIRKETLIPNRDFPGVTKLPDDPAIKARATPYSFGWQLCLELPDLDIVDQFMKAWRTDLTEYLDLLRDLRAIGGI